MSATTPEGPVDDTMNRVELVIPASPEYVVLARLTAAGIGTRMGMTYDELEDLRVIAAETCRILIGDNGAATGTLTIGYVVSGDALEIEAIGRTTPPAVAPAEDDLSVHLLSALADKHEVIVAGGEGRVHVVKRLLG